jgi:hypothetical protein
MGTQHRRTFSGKLRAIERGGAVAMKTARLAPKEHRNYSELSWKSTTCVSSAFGPNRPDQDRRRLLTTHRSAIDPVPNFQRASAKAL